MPKDIHRVKSKTVGERTYLQHVANRGLGTIYQNSHKSLRKI